jgi:hypothetical protein
MVEGNPHWEQEKQVSPIGSTALVYMEAQNPKDTCYANADPHNQTRSLQREVTWQQFSRFNEKTNQQQHLSTESSVPTASTPKAYILRTVPMSMVAIKT